METIIKDFDEMPSKVFFLDENGNFIDKKVSEKTPLTKYWSEKTRLLGVLMLGSSMLLLIILLGESNLLSNIVKMVTGILGALL